MVSVPYTPIAQQEVIVHPTNGMSSYAVVTTDSYLSMNLKGQMQNAAPYIGWSLDKWIQAITADAQQRCAAYPESCAGTTPEALGAKWGTIAFNLMQGVSAPVQQPQSTPVSTPVATVPAQTTINVPLGGQIIVQNPGIPLPSAQPSYVTQNTASNGAVSDNVGQSAIAAAGGNPASPIIPTGDFILPSELSWLANTVSIGGYNVPIWIGLAGAVGLFMLSQGSSRGRRY